MMSPDAPPSPRKVLLIGWDAADWSVAQPLIEAGKMPSLKRLIEEGVSGDLATIRPVLSPMLWTSIATGKRAWQHGIHGFTEPCPETGGIRPITNLSRKTKAIWNILNQRGLRSSVIGWWPSHPAEPINGVMVTNHYQRVGRSSAGNWAALAPGTVHPQSIAGPLSALRIHPRELEFEHVLPFIPRLAEVDQRKDRRVNTCATIIAEISSIHAAATACMQLEPWDFMAVYYDGIDHFGHGFMKFNPPRRPWINEKDFELYKNVIAAAYQYHDMMLEVLLGLAGDDTTVMLISDHGFEPGALRPREIPNEPAGPAVEHSPYGIFVIRGPGIKAGERIHGANLLDIAPTLLHLYGLPVGRDMDGKVLVNCFTEDQQPTYIPSWDKIPGDDGRHPQDTTISPAESREAVKQLVDLGYIDEPNSDQAEAVDETVRELQFNLANAYRDGGRQKEAAQILERLWIRWPYESRFGQGLIACQLALGNPTAARQTYDLLEVRKKEDMARAAEELKALMESLETAPNKERKDPPGPAMIQRIRRLQARAGSNPQALRYFKASILSAEGHHEDALKTLPAASEVPDNHKPSLLGKKGEIYLKLGRWEEAGAAYQDVLQLDPKNAAAHLGLANSLLRRKHYFEAASEVTAALELQFHNPYAHLLYGRVLLRLGNARLAEQVLLTSIAQAPRFVAAHTLLAYVYDKRLEDPERAKAHRDLASQARRAQRALRNGDSPEDLLVHLDALPAMPSINGRLSNTGRAPLIVVSGLPRSGTSLMMQMLHAGGIEVITDDERTPDASNPKGYFEDERVKRLANETADDTASWLEESQGKAVKIVAPLLPFIPDHIPLKVIFMERAVDEVIRSQRTMLSRQGKTGTDEAALARAYGEHLRQLIEFCDSRRNMDLLPVAYSEAIALPSDVAKKVAGFLGQGLKTDAMAGAVDPNLYRERK